MLGRCAGVSLFALLLISMLPTVNADDTQQSSTPLPSGATTNGYVCYDDGCSPTDQTDWWKVHAYKGDIVQVYFSGSMNNGNWLCVNDGWEADFSLHDSAGSQITSQAMSDGGSATTLSTTMQSEGHVYVKIKGKDSWCNDGVDYTLTPSLNQDNRDTDEDGFIDNEDDCDLIVGTSTNDRKGCIDTDGDGWSDQDSGWDVQNGADAFENDGTQWRDRDFDGYGDNALGNQPDHCPDNRGYSTDDRFGCIDSDADGYSDADPGGLDGLEPWYAHPDGLADSFPYESSQWRDTDGDGFGDNWDDPMWNETHIAWGIGEWLLSAEQPDACPFIVGLSFADRYGCPDADGDAWSDPSENWSTSEGADAFPTEPTQWRDRDFDGYGDNQTIGANLIDDFPDNPTQFRDTDSDGWGDNQTYGATQIDDFPMIPSQYRDTDGDGYGDNLSGFEGDVCLNSDAEEVESGWISRFDRLGCRDTDSDGYSDPTEDWIPHPEGFADAFSSDPSQWYDTDGDGFGDNLEWFDGQAWRLAYRGDGCRTTSGESTFDRWGCPDSDGDGWSNPTSYWLASPGGMADAWPDDSTQWHDSDGDGRGDNPSGTTADVCPAHPGTSVGPSAGGDRWGCPDTDGDGWSNLGDAFIHEPTQWRDTDGDGFGDEEDGNEADACPTIRGTSILDRLGCRDTDGDGWSDPTDDWEAHPYGPADSFPTEALQWRDTDADGFGDVPLGAMRDDCPELFGTSTRDVQGCEDSNDDGWSNEYGEWNAALAIMGEDPAASWMTYLIIGIAFILGASGALVTRTLRVEEKTLDEDFLLTNENMSTEPPLDSLPDLAIPLPPAPGGEESA
jgi:hypothetical protein